MVGRFAWLQIRDRAAFVRLTGVLFLVYLATGLWPLFNIESFQQVTGPKTDLWLVRTVGVLVDLIQSLPGAEVRRSGSLDEFGRDYGADAPN